MVPFSISSFKWKSSCVIFLRKLKVYLFSIPMHTNISMLTCIVEEIQGRKGREGELMVSREATQRFLPETLRNLSP